MSLVIAIYIPTGVIISGDSRTTGTLTKQVPNPQNAQQKVTVQTNLALSDSTYKVFKLFDRFGVGTFGNALLNDLPIAHYTEQFEIQHKQNPPNTTQDLVDELTKYFRQFNPVPQLGFIVSGYDNNEQYVFDVDVLNNKSKRHNYDPKKGSVTYGIVRGGETDVVNRLFNNPNRIPLFQSMNLQDAVDFSRHLIRTTIDQMRFEPAVPTIGGEIDTLMITADETRFLRRKDLMCN